MSPEPKLPASSSIARAALESLGTDPAGATGERILETTLAAVRRRRNIQRTIRAACAGGAVLFFFSVPFLPQPDRPVHPRQEAALFANHHGAGPEPLPTPIPVAAPRTVARFSTEPGNHDVSRFHSANVSSAIQTITDTEVLELCARFDGGGFVSLDGKKKLVVASTSRPSWE